MLLVVAVVSGAIVYFALFAFKKPPALNSTSTPSFIRQITAAGLTTLNETVTAEPTTVSTGVSERMSHFEIRQFPPEGFRRNRAKRLVTQKQNVDCPVRSIRFGVQSVRLSADLANLFEASRPRCFEYRNYFSVRNRRTGGGSACSGRWLSLEAAV